MRYMTFLLMGFPILASAHPGHGEPSTDPWSFPHFTGNVEHLPGLLLLLVGIGLVIHALKSEKKKKNA